MLSLLEPSTETYQKHMSGVNHLGWGSTWESNKLSLGRRNLLTFAACLKRMLRGILETFGGWG